MFLREYVKEAMGQAIYDELEDGTFSGRIGSELNYICYYIEEIRIVKK